MIQRSTQRLYEWLIRYHKVLHELLKTVEQKQKFTLIKIKDNGIGIPDSMKEKVFLPNFTTKNSGTGLGLAMCQQIIESANGKLYFTSVQNIGTIFFVELPIIKQQS